MTRLFSVHGLSDQELLAATLRLAAHQRRATARLVAAISEVDARRLYLQEGCSSIFAYCTRVLRLSEHAAYLRIASARLARRFPVVLERIADGSLTLTNARLLAPVLTAENHIELLDAARHKSKYDVEQLVAALRPADQPELYTFQITVTREVRDQLRRAQNLLRHTIPDGDAGKIFGRALTVLLAQIEKKKLAATTRPRRPLKVQTASRRIPARVRREVWERDGGRCAFVGTNGRCEERGFLEFHHVQPYAKGGPPAPGNIQLRCRAHNQHEAELAFGRPTHAGTSVRGSPSRR